MTKHTGKEGLIPGDYIDHEFTNSIIDLKFTNTDFDRYYFYKCSFEDFYFNLGTNTTISLQCEKEGKITLQKRIIANKGIFLFIKLENIKASKFNVFDVHNRYHYFIEVHDSKFNTDISVNASQTSIFISNTKLQNLHVYSNTINEILIQKESKLELLNLTTLSQVEKLSINKFNFENSISKQLSFEKVNFPNSFSFSKSYIYNLSFQDCIILKNYFFLNQKKLNTDLRITNLFLHNNKYPNGLIIEFSDKKFGHINISCGEEYTGSIALKHLVANSILISGSKNNHNITLHDIKLSSLTLINFSTEARLVIDFIRSIKKGFDFSIQNSELTNIDLFNIDFQNEKASLSIRDSVLRDFNSVNVVWPSKIQIIQALSKSTLRSTYLQLKNAMHAQNNKIQALQFEALEMQAYRQELKSTKGKYAEKSILFLSRSNSFGQDFGKALLIYLVFAFSLAAIVSFAATGIAIGTDDFTSYSNDYWAAFGAAINPTHSFADLCQNLDIKDAPGWLIVSDVFLRIIAAFFYFQIISAFRKYAKG